MTYFRSRAGTGAVLILALLASGCGDSAARQASAGWPKSPCAMYELVFPEAARSVRRFHRRRVCTTREPECGGCARACGSASSLEELHGPLVLLGGGARPEGAEVAALAGPGILLYGVETIEARGEFPYHRCAPCEATRVAGPGRSIREVRYQSTFKNVKSSPQPHVSNRPPPARAFYELRCTWYQLVTSTLSP